MAALTSGFHVMRPSQVMTTQHRNAPAATDTNALKTVVRNANMQTNSGKNVQIDGARVWATSANENCFDANGLNTSGFVVLPFNLDRPYAFHQIARRSRRVNGKF